MALDKYYGLGSVLRDLNNYFTPESNLFMDYCLWFLERDFNTLKTCYCKRVEKLDIPFGNIGGNRVLCVFNIPFEGTPLFFEEVKMQIVLTTEEGIDAEIELCKDAGYLYGYVLNTRTEEITSLGYLGEPVSE